MKKLIKYEQKLLSKKEEKIVEPVRNELYEFLHLAGTVASRAKEIKRRENIITVEVKKSKTSKPRLPEHCESCKENVPWKLDEGELAKCGNPKYGIDKDREDAIVENAEDTRKTCGTASSGKLSAKSAPSKVTTKSKKSCKHPFRGCPQKLSN